MKTITLSIVVAITATTILGGSYWYYLQATKTSITVMYDITDPLHAAPDTIALAKHIRTAMPDWGTSYVRVLAITNFTINKAAEFNISANFPLISNPNTRERNLQSNVNEIVGHIMALSKVDTGRNRSIVYVPIVTELNALAQSNARNKQLIVFSDLMENDSSSFSAYRSHEQSMLKDSPKSVQEMFEDKIHMGSLKGISLYLLYDAPNPAAQDRFLAVANIWKQVFQKHGIDTVIIGSNISVN